MSQSNTSTHFELSVGDTFAPHIKNTLSECIELMNGPEYRGRNTGKESDKYWQTRPFQIRKVTTTREFIPIDELIN